MYLYRAVDKAGQTVDFFLSRNRDVNAAKSFLRSAMKSTRLPTKITLDAYAASHRAVREMKADGELPGCVKVRSSQYLDNLVEIAFTQPNVLAARMSGNHVTDFDFAVGHKDTVD